jgi:TM2 domain-containing membrane protein YozV
MNAPKDKMVAGILAILLGGLGIHHFYLGNTTRGIIYIVLMFVGVSPILGLIDGIMFLTKPDDVFQRCYLNWFCGEGKTA